MHTEYMLRELWIESLRVYRIQEHYLTTRKVQNPLDILVYQKSIYLYWCPNKNNSEIIIVQNNEEVRQHKD